MNKVVLIGRLTKDPELTYTAGKGTALTKITLAVPKYNSKTKQNEADFIPVQIWGKRAESTAKYTNKGSQVSVSGRIQTGSYEAKDGTKRYTTNVVADEIIFLSSTTNSGTASESTGAGSGSSSYEEDITPVDDGDMPF